MPRKRMRGVVTSDKMSKTIVVEVTRTFPHSLYQKYMQKVKTYKVHDENESCSVGDLVEIVEVRPISKEKRWRVLRILEHTGHAPEEQTV